MLTGEARITERQYRTIESLSQSDIKLFAENRRKFYKKYILKENVEEETSKAMVMGNLIDCLLLTPEDFDNKFIMSTCSEIPTAKMLDFCDNLYKVSMEDVAEDGTITTDFMDRAQRAYTLTGYKIALSRVMGDFIGKEPENYFNEIISSRPRGLNVISTQDIENATRVVTALRTSQFTAPILNVPDTNEMDFLNQFPLTEFFLDGISCKGLVDRLEINHEEKFIQPWDLKAVWAVEDFYYEYYLRRKGYLQAAMYDLGCTNLRNLEYPGYEVRPMKLIVCDTINFYDPLIYELSHQDILDGIKGFNHNNREYKGLQELVGDIKWHTENQIWGMSKENYLNNGRVQVSSFKVA